jgi:N-methylhydantoinase B
VAVAAAAAAAARVAAAAATEPERRSGSTDGSVVDRSGPRRDALTPRPASFREVATDRYGADAMARASKAPPDPVRLEVFHHLLTAICEEAGALLQRSAVSPNIRERRDYSCALFDAEGRLVAQAAHIPVHLGSAADAVAAVRRRFDVDPGDVVLLNDPYAGGTHLPDLTMVRGIFCEGRLAFFAVHRAHHADVGGAAPGSMAIAADLHGEGLVLPPVRIRRRGEPVTDVLDLLFANVRGVDERRIDLQAQEASLARVDRRIQELIARHGLATMHGYASHLMDASEVIARDVVATLRPGRFTAADVLEDDGVGNGPFTIRLTLTIERHRLRFDFSKTDRQASGGINANRSIVLAACVYALRCLCASRLPTNDGLFRLIEVVTEQGTLVDPIRPAPVAGGNVETSQRLVDVCFAALRRAAPGRIPAASAGTMSNLSMGGHDASGRAFAFYETLPGGAGALRGHGGSSAVQTHMTNTRNTPIEEFERTLPVRVVALTVRRGSGGAGRWRGGDGIVKELELRARAIVSLLADRHRRGPPGIDGGEAGATGAAQVRIAGRRRALASKSTVELGPGDRIRIETPGGGGVGRP